MTQTARPSLHQRDIAAILATMNRTDIDARWIEAGMRCQYGTLDHLDAVTFREEVEIGVMCVDEGGIENAELTAQSYGM